jgi:hypothetical protein
MAFCYVNVIFILFKKSVLFDATVVWSGKVFVATGCPLVSSRVVHDAIDAGAKSTLAVISVVTRAIAKVVVHAQVVPELVSQVLIV